MYIMTYRRRLHIFAIDKRNHLKIYMFGIVGETRAHDSFELIWSDNIAKVYNLLRYKSLCTCDLKMFNFHIKQTEGRLYFPNTRTILDSVQGHERPL